MKNCESSDENDDGDPEVGVGENLGPDVRGRTGL